MTRLRRKERAREERAALDGLKLGHLGRLEYQTAVAHLGADDVDRQLPLRLAGVLKDGLKQGIVVPMTDTVDQPRQPFG